MVREPRAFAGCDEPPTLIDQRALLDVPGTERLERLVRLAASALRVEIAAVAVHTSDRVWFQAIAGASAVVAGAETLCEIAFRSEGPTVIGDARADPRVGPYSRDAGNPGLRFFASHPLFAVDGGRIGGVCVMDFEPREFDGLAMRTLADIARMVETELRDGSLTRTQVELANNLEAARPQLLRDDLTQTWNRTGILEILARECARASRHQQRLGAALVDLDQLKRINDAHGHRIGDRVLRSAAERMIESVRPYDAIGRYGGEEFLVVIVENDPAVLFEIAERIRRNVAETRVHTDGAAIQITVSIGVAYTEPWQKMDSSQLVQIAIEALDSAKRVGPNRVAVSNAATVART